MSNAIAYLGGTFNPVHFGHLRVATELGEALGVSTVYLMPCYQPVHRSVPTETAQARLDMLQLAARRNPNLAVDSREITRQGPSYTVDSLRAIRQEQSNNTAIYFAMGADAFNDIQSWKQWQELFDYANLVVMHRPGSVIDWQCDFLKARVRSFNGTHQPNGALYELELSALDISSTDIRQRVQAGQSIDYLLPETVAEYIDTNNLYR